MGFTQKRDIIIFIISIALLIRFGLVDDTQFYAVYEHQSVIFDPDYADIQPRPGAFYNADQGAWFGPYVKQGTDKHELCQWWAELEHKHSQWAHGYSLPLSETIRVSKIVKHSAGVDCYFSVKTQNNGWRNADHQGTLKLLTYRALLPHNISLETCKATRQSIPATKSPPTYPDSDIQRDDITFEGHVIANSWQFSDGKSRWSQLPDVLLWGNKTEHSDKSHEYPSKAAACTQGFKEFRRRAPSTSVLHSLTADYEQDTCFLKRKDEFVFALGISENIPYGNSAPSGLLQLKHQDGSVTHYYRKPSARHYEVAGTCSDSHLVINRGLVQFSSPKEQKIFNQDGLLIEQRSATGQRVYRYQYNQQGELIAIKDALGQQFNYLFRHGLLKQVQAPSGKILQFDHIGDLLMQVVFPDQTTRRYDYRDKHFPSRLTGITDQRGVHFATGKYHTQNVEHSCIMVNRASTSGIHSTAWISDNFFDIAVASALAESFCAKFLHTR